MDMYFQPLFIRLMARHRIVFYGWISLVLGLALIYFLLHAIYTHITLMGA